MNGAINSSITGESSLLLLSFIFGMVLMAGYDLLRIWRHLVHHGTVLLALEDFIYWVGCGIGTFAMLYHNNDGQIRWYVLAGIASGMLLWNGWISPVAVRLTVRILHFSGRQIRRFTGIFAGPVRYGKRKFRKITLFFKNELKKTVKMIKIGISRF